VSAAVPFILFLTSDVELNRVSSRSRSLPSLLVTRIAARDRGAAQQQDRRAQQADARRSAVGTSSSALAERNKVSLRVSFAFLPSFSLFILLASHLFASPIDLTPLTTYIYASYSLAGYDGHVQEPRGCEVRRRWWSLSGAVNP